MRIPLTLHHYNRKRRKPLCITHPWLHLFGMLVMIIVTLVMFAYGITQLSPH